MYTQVIVRKIRVLDLSHPHETKQGQSVCYPLGTVGHTHTWSRRDVCFCSSYSWDSDPLWFGGIWILDAPPMPIHTITNQPAHFLIPATSTRHHGGSGLVWKLVWHAAWHWCPVWITAYSHIGTKFSNQWEDGLVKLCRMLVCDLYVMFIESGKRHDQHF